MTDEEAIHYAECLKNNYTIDFDDLEDFCNMAIEALKGHREIDYDHDTICGMTINEIIDVMNGLTLEHIYNLQMTMENLSAWKELYVNEVVNQMMEGIYGK